MARYTGPACKLCRREGEKLFLKGERCYTTKCALERRAYAPGEHGRMRQTGRDSDYSRQLRAKQKARRVYGVLEKQFRRYFDVARKRPGMTGLTLLQTLESRLDNVVYRMGYAPSRTAARQLVTHGHFLVNGTRTDVPSMMLKTNDVISVHPESRKNEYFKIMIEEAAQRTCAAWIKRDLDHLSGQILRVPERAEIDGNLNEQLIVEYYSR
ncbi:MAG: 30S ribosomal protein S4 [Anaerolineae bacterium]|jgi:small subunit ribosomal protein S4|nr:30S ribosomal protein S4 [Anaerolineae bacterium]